MVGTMTAPTINERLDRICKRQTARLLDHMRQTMAVPDPVAAAIVRAFGFFAEDAKSAIRESSKEADRAENHRS